MGKSRDTVHFAPAADRDLRRLPEETQRRIVMAAEALADEPRPQGAKKLAGMDDLWRVRVGDYRLVDQVRDARLIVLVVSIGHRRDIYRKLRKGKR